MGKRQHKWPLLFGKSAQPQEDYRTAERILNKLCPTVSVSVDYETLAYRALTRVHPEEEGDN